MVLTFYTVTFGLLPKQPPRVDMYHPQFTDEEKETQWG